MLTTNEPGWLRNILWRLLEAGELLPASTWQSQDVSGMREMNPVELRHETIKLLVPDTMVSAQLAVRPNLPWAEDHFQERVGGEPLNPPPSEAWWPFARAKNAEHKEVGDTQFSHTYPERMWPKRAGNPIQTHEGIRYQLGDLGDLVNQLIREPLTRQAYLPIWFPEDTGAVQGQRVPCTLGYHFLIRNHKATITYYMRSCDALRHLKDDVYMAMRLLQWVVGKLQEHRISIDPDMLIMHISSLHIFEGDKPIVERWLRDMDEADEDQGFGYGT